MRITEELLNPDQKGPWASIAKKVARKYRSTTGQAFDGELLTQAAHLDARPTEVADAVSWGFARRAVRMMHATCTVCGAHARRRRGEYRGVYLCASCILPIDFQRQVNWLLRAQDPASGVARSVIGQHQLPPLVRNAIQGHMWRNLVLPDGDTLLYLTDIDLESITTWLLRLGLLLEREAGERATARMKAADTE